MRSQLGCFEPNADVFVDEDSSRVVAVIEVAGADAESVRVRIEERYLMVTGRRAEATRVRGGSFVQKEIAYGEFAKRIALPVAVEHDGAAAGYDNGLLVIALPIAATAYRATARTDLHILVTRTSI